MDKALTEDQPEKSDPPEAGGTTAAPATEPTNEAEMRVRHALGLMGGKATESTPTREARLPGPRAYSPGSTFSNRPPRRFVQDGEVPTTILRNRRNSDTDADQPVINRLAAAEAAADAERQARERAEQAHRDVLDTIRTLQTRQGHLELARDEALAALKASMATLESLHEALRNHQEQLAAAQAAMAASERAVRASTAALSAERTARAAAETALQDALIAQQARSRAARPNHAARSVQEPAPRHSVGSSSRKRTLAERPKAATPRKPAAANRKPKEQQKASGRPSTAAIRKNGPHLSRKVRVQSRPKTTKAVRRTSLSSPKPAKRAAGKHQGRKTGRARTQPRR